MGNFSIPVKQIIINADSQVDVVETSLLPASGSLAISGFLSTAITGPQFELLAAATRIRVVAAAAAVKEDADYTFTLGAAAGDVIIVRENSLLLTPTEFQNQDIDKRYQLPLCADAAATAVAAAAAINADPYAKVVATAPGAGVLTLVSKLVGREFNVYTSENNVTLLEPVAPVKDPDAVATLGTGIYDTLKNIEFSKNIEEDRNQEYYPKKGTQYNQYYFEVNWTTVDLGGHDVPSLLPASGRTAFQMWIADGLTADTEMAAAAVLLNA
jgi:hypothetical protein